MAFKRLQESGWATLIQTSVKGSFVLDLLIHLINVQVSSMPKLTALGQGHKGHRMWWLA